MSDNLLESIRLNIINNNLITYEEMQILLNEIYKSQGVYFDLTHIIKTFEEMAKDINTPWTLNLFIKYLIFYRLKYSNICISDEALESIRYIDVPPNWIYEQLKKRCKVRKMIQK
jgi:hypothetical protein